jgi:hypothetical protein
MRKAVALAASLALAAALAACGEKEEPEPVAPDGGGTQVEKTTTATEPTGGNGGGGGQTLSPEAEVEAAIRGVLGGNDAAYACVEAATARYVKAAYGDEAGCRAAVAKQKQFRVTVSAIDIKGDTATARAKPAGGPNKGETIEVELVDDGGWKVDSAVSNAPPGP